MNRLAYLGGKAHELLWLHKFLELVENKGAVVGTSEVMVSINRCIETEYSFNKPTGIVSRLSRALIIRADWKGYTCPYSFLGGTALVNDCIQLLNTLEKEGKESPEVAKLVNEVKGYSDSAKNKRIKKGYPLPSYTEAVYDLCLKLVSLNCSSTTENVGPVVDAFYAVGMATVTPEEMRDVQERSNRVVKLKDVRETVLAQTNKLVVDALSTM